MLSCFSRTIFHALPYTSTSTSTLFEEVVLITINLSLRHYWFEQGSREGVQMLKTTLVKNSTAAAPNINNTTLWICLCLGHVAQICAFDTLHLCISTSPSYNHVQLSRLSPTSLSYNKRFAVHNEMQLQINVQIQLKIQLQSFSRMTCLTSLP